MLGFLAQQARMPRCRNSCSICSVKCLRSCLSGVSCLQWSRSVPNCNSHGHLDQMRVIYLFLVAILLLLFWKVIAELRRRDKVLTPILGWIIGLGFFMLAPLTLMVLNGGYEFPFFYGVNETYAKVDLS